MSASVTERRFLTIREAAATTRLSERTLRRYVDAGVLNVVQPAGRGHALRIDEAEIERWTTQTSTAGPSSAVAEYRARGRDPHSGAVEPDAARGSEGAR